MNKNLSSKDWEALSAYLDNQLSAPERNRLETRLKKNPEMKLALDKLSQTRRVLRSTPKLRAPRSFALTPEMAGLRSARPRLYPVFRLVFAVASILFVLVFASDLTGQFSTLYSRQVRAPLSANNIPEAAIATSGVEAEKEAQAPTPGGSVAASPTELPQPGEHRIEEGFATAEIPVPGAETDSESLQMPTEMLSKVEAGEELAGAPEETVIPSSTPTIAQEAVRITETTGPELAAKETEPGAQTAIPSTIRLIEFVLGGLVLLSGALVLYFRRSTI